MRALRMEGDYTMINCFMCGAVIKRNELYGQFNEISICNLCITNDADKIDAALQAALVKQAEEQLNRTEEG
jgi:hypothetical protein